MLKGALCPEARVMGAPAGVVLVEVAVAPPEVTTVTPPFEVAPPFE
jgi:hypothetical protein